MEFTQTTFDYDFGGVTPQDCLTLKAMTAEELYEVSLVSLDEVLSFSHGSPYREKPYDKLLLHVGELFRRNVADSYVWQLFSKETEHGGDKDYHINAYKAHVTRTLKTIRLVKQTTMRMLKAPLLSKQINDLMDEILDKNGNKPSQFKDFLTPDHYRMVRMGCDVSVWSVEEQEVLLACLKKM
jgi:hypothetical protein